MTRSRPFAGSPSASRPERSSACSGRTAPGRRRQSRSWRLSRRDAGRVEVLGVDPATAGREWRERIGVVLQSGSLYGQLSVTEILRLFGGYYERPRDAGEVITLIGLEEKRDAHVRTLSGGQQRRLDLGLALVGDHRARVPRRADHRVRSRRAPPRLGRDPLAPRAPQDRALDDALPRRGRAALRPGGRPTGRRDRCDRAARRVDWRPAADRDPLLAERRGGRDPHRRADEGATRVDLRGSARRLRAPGARGPAAEPRRGLSLADRRGRG